MFRFRGFCQGAWALMGMGVSGFMVLGFSGLGP